ncbi:DUF4192 domain-containing protein [Actinotalea sp. K2]|uniref:DUF4192 domain-containing protein n=1 Tax=Actinotalea sp. K2 TaxID=2939438 RepID=UPI002017DAFF|nr:DUF4192 domain-containing protein [Actinotalea sp. K2]MCL3863014.1 DUF4192 domain-containing protein [Actinotalea sp. K2]
MSSTITQTLRVNDPREVLAAIAYRLGFHPAESVVVVSLRGPRRALGLVARIDLLDADQAASTLAGHLVTDGADAALVVAYTDDANRAHDATVFLDDALNVAGIAPVGVWWVTSTDYRAINPRRPRQCPQTGQPLDLDTTIVAATMVTLGHAAASSRDSIGITAAPQAARALAAQAGEAWTVDPTPSGRATGLGLWREALTTERTPQVAGRLAAALTDVLVRDAVLCDVIGDPDVATAVAVGTTSAGVGTTLAKVVDPATGVAPDPEVTGPATDLLTYVAAHTTSAAALTLLAVLAWWGGDGARASVYVEAAHRIDADYRLAALVSDALGAGMAPGWLRTR